jgi:hypothetical protein
VGNLIVIGGNAVLLLLLVLLVARFDRGFAGEDNDTKA